MASGDVICDVICDVTSCDVTMPSDVTRSSQGKYVYSSRHVTFYSLVLITVQWIVEYKCRGSHDLPLKGQVLFGSNGGQETNLLSTKSVP